VLDGRIMMISKELENIDAELEEARHIQDWLFKRSGRRLLGTPEGDARQAAYFAANAAVNAVIDRRNRFVQTLAKSA
jgi:hypothetical protein